MTKPRPCGCKGCRTCLICETQFGAEKLKLQVTLDKDKGYVYCPFCDKCWKGWDINLYKEHPNHTGDAIDISGFYIKLDFISEEEETELIKNIDEVTWDTSQSGRRKQNYGPKTNFKKKKVVLGNFSGFPKFSKFIQDRFRSIELLKDYDVIEQCSLEYDPSKGASIDPHIDDCWIWGERIVTVNCLSDCILTLTPYRGEKSKYNLLCTEEYSTVVKPDGSVDLAHDFGNAYKNSKHDHIPDIIIRVPMPRYSILVMYGQPRYHWEHFILREDVTSRRVCIAYREFTPPYINGKHTDIGDEIRQKSKNFWESMQDKNILIVTR